MSDWIYWESQQSSQLCAVHAINSLLQAPVFTEIELGEIGQELDAEERIAQGGKAAYGQNVSLDGFFSIQVIIRALQREGIHLSYLDTVKFHSSLYDPSSEQGLVFNRNYHWQTLRKIRGTWYDLNSLNEAPGPVIVSDFMLTSTIEAMIGNGFTVFVARGEFAYRAKEDYEWRRHRWQFWLSESLFAPQSSSYNYEEAMRMAIEASRADAAPQEVDPELEAAIALSLEQDSVSHNEKTESQPAAIVLRPEPVSDPSAIGLRVRFPNGESHSRKFLPTDFGRDIASWVQSIIHEPVALFFQMPRRELPLEETLASSGIRAPVLLLAEKVNKT